MVMVPILGLMERSMKVIGLTVKEMVTVQIIFQVERSMLVIGKIIKEMDLELTIGLMEIFTKVNLRTI